jgi:hypothetical protein
MRYWGSIAISVVIFGITMNVIGGMLGIPAYNWRVMILMFSTVVVNGLCIELETWLSRGKGS